MLLAGCLLMWLPAARAQVQSDILEAYIEYGLKENLGLSAQRLTYQSQAAALQEARGMALPRLSFEASYTLAGGGRAIEFPVGDLFNPVYQTLNKLSGEERFPTDLENVNEQFLPNNFHETKLRVIQPIFNPDIRYNRRIQEKRLAMQGASREAYRDELIKSIKVAYFQYLQTEAVIDIYDASQTLLLELLRVNQRLVDNNKATYEVISSTKYELDKLEKDRAAAEKNRQMARANFNFLLNRPLESLVEVDSTLGLPVLSPDSLSTLQNQALRARPELQEVRLGLEAREEAILMEKARRLPTLAAVLDVGYQGFEYTFDQDQDYWLGQVSLSWTLFNGQQRKARITQAQLQSQALAKEAAAIDQQVRLQVEQAYYQHQASQVALRASLTGLAHARDVFRIREKKYLEDQASLLELTDARTQYIQARLNVVVDTYQVLMHRANLEWASGQTPIQP